MSSVRIGLAQRLFFGSGALIIAMLVVIVVVWMALNHIVETADRVGDDRVPQLRLVGEIELNVTRTSLQARHAILSKTPAELSETLGAIDKLHETLKTDMDRFGKAMVTEEGRKAYAEMPAKMDRFWALAGENVALTKAGKRDEAFEHLKTHVIPARNTMLEVLGREKQRQGEQVSKEIDAIEADVVQDKWLIAGALVIVALGLLGFSFYVVRVLRMLGAEPVDVKEAADAVAGGDLSRSIAVSKGDERSVMAAMKRMSEELSRAVGTVRNNADTVATASAQIASGNLDLSSRTEEQAAALQRTAASMEELGATVRQNADNARQANQLALGASGVAVKGGEVVSQVVSTMGEINASSKRIADIIGTIDGIAFQTNILALNAAVEAARAGEQGRGFAVVAGEVRNLAQRSAEAAREIKSLITASVERVEQGSILVGQAGTTMNEIVASIQRVTDIMGEISAASVEQSTGVEQVTQAVSEMDRATQQNAALVEQSAAAAESLRAQAQALVSAVASFRVAGAEGRPAAPAQPIATTTQPAKTAASAVAKASAPATWNGAERRGPDRATNVVRPAFAPAAAAAAAPAAPAQKPAVALPAANGTDDDWTTF